MKITTYMLRIYEILEGGNWLSAADLSDRIGAPSANLKTSLERLTGEGVLESLGVKPKRYRLAVEPKGRAAEQVMLIKQERDRRRREPSDVAALRAQPGYQKIAAEAVGYCALVLPASDLYQGFFVLPESIENGRHLIARIREQVLSTFGSVTTTAIDGLDEEANTIVGILAAMAASLAAGEFGQTVEAQQKCVSALGGIAAMLEGRGAPYFFITGRPPDTAGSTDAWHTTVQPVPSSEIQMAKVIFQRTPAEYMASLLDKIPEVQEIKKRRANERGHH